MANSYLKYDKKYYSEVELSDLENEELIDLLKGVNVDDLEDIQEAQDERISQLELEVDEWKEKAEAVPVPNITTSSEEVVVATPMETKRPSSNLQALISDVESIMSYANTVKPDETGQMKPVTFGKKDLIQMFKKHGFI